MRCFASNEQAIAAALWSAWPMMSARSEQDYAAAEGPRDGGVLPATAARSSPHMSTANVARDLDLLRQAVGDRQLTYLGYSYGTAIGEY